MKMKDYLERKKSDMNCTSANKPIAFMGAEVKTQAFAFRKNDSAYLY